MGPLFIRALRSHASSQIARKGIGVELQEEIQYIKKGGQKKRRGKKKIVKMPTLETSNFNIVCAVLGGFITLFGLVSYLFKEKFYLSEACVLCSFPSLNAAPNFRADNG